MNTKVSAQASMFFFWLLSVKNHNTSQYVRILVLEKSRIMNKIDLFQAYFIIRVFLRPTSSEIQHAIAPLRFVWS